MDASLDIKQIAEIAKGFHDKAFAVKDILNVYLDSRQGLFEGPTDEEISKLAGQISRKINKDIKQKGGLFKYGKNNKGKQVKTLYALIKKKPVKEISPIAQSNSANPMAPPITTDTLFIGRAGEYAVMSELLFRGYNANEMSVDDGIDIIASKNNVVYYIQVKTAVLQPNMTVQVPGIKKKGYDSYINTNMRYIVCVRSAGNDNIENKSYVVFNNKDLDWLRSYKCLRETDDDFYIKLRFSDGKIFAYNGDESREVTHLRNNFKF